MAIPLVAAMARHLPPASGERTPCVLVPGAGLGRLVFDLASAGYAATGVESSYLMLVPAWYIIQRLLHAGRGDGASIQPYVHQTSNVQSAAHLTRVVAIPGEPGTRARPAKPLAMRLVANRFEALSADSDHAGAWDAVATCFLVDACASVLEVIDGVAAVLRAGGIWASLGPLLYHHNGAAADSEYGGAAGRGVPKLCADELLQLVEASGFEVLERGTRECRYCDDPLSMAAATYRCLEFVARKR